MPGKENIIHLFLENAERLPGKAALVYREEKLTYSELKKQVQETAAGFVSKGINKGDKVLVLIPMSVDLYRVTLALFYVGATAVFLDEWAGLKRLNECCKTVPCNALVSSWKLRLISWLTPELRRILIKLRPATKSAKVREEIADVSPDDRALITFTTGSTGKPKAAIRTHRILSEQFSALKDIIRPEMNEVDIPSLPIILLINLAAGCTSVIPNYNARKPQNLSPEKIWKQIEDNSVTRITASPYFIKRIAEFVLGHSKRTNQIKKVCTGGAPVFPAEADLLRKAFPQAEIIVVYGSTEAEPISSIAADYLQEAAINRDSLLPAGKPYRNTEVRIIGISDVPIIASGNDAFEKLFLPAGEVGEIIVGGPHVLSEYYNSEEAFRRNKIVVDGKVWHRTGDAGCLDANGNLLLAGRCQQIIRYGNHNIYPFLFENFCKSIPGVVLGTMIKKDEKLLTCIEAKAGADRLAIEEAVKKFDAVQTVIFMERMPRDKRHFSKIDYSALAKQLPS